MGIHYYLLHTTLLLLLLLLCWTVPSRALTHFTTHVHSSSMHLPHPLAPLYTHDCNLHHSLSSLPGHCLGRRLFWFTETGTTGHNSGNGTWEPGMPGTLAKDLAARCGFSLSVFSFFPSMFLSPLPDCFAVSRVWLNLC